MYVCICQRVTDKAIQDAVQNGASCLNEVQQQLGVASGCGSCAQMAESIIQELQNLDANLAYAAA